MWIKIVRNSSRLPFVAQPATMASENMVSSYFRPAFVVSDCRLFCVFLSFILLDINYGFVSFICEPQSRSSMIDHFHFLYCVVGYWIRYESNWDTPNKHRFVFFHYVLLYWDIIKLSLFLAIHVNCRLLCHCFSTCSCSLIAYIANNMNQVHTAPLGAVWSGFLLFAFMLKVLWNAFQYIQQTWKSDAIFSTKILARLG